MRAERFRTSHVEGFRVIVGSASVEIVVKVTVNFGYGVWENRKVEFDIRLNL